ncbi:MAG: hypothetical protein J6112_04150 [Clostridia bacterium]|nr:hypothetical protein [Clostridia bacterium]
MDPLYQKHFFSLMWPDYQTGRAKEQAAKDGSGRLFNQDIMERDINANMIFQGMDIRTEGKDYIVARISDMVTDEATISYRQAVLKDFLKYPEIEVLANSDLLPLIIQLGRMEKTNLAHDDDVRKTVWRMELLKIYVQCMTALDRIFCSPTRTFDSEGLNKLKELVSSIVNDENYNELVALLPTLSDDIKGIQSITLGINLDNELHPVESVLLSVSEKPIKKRGMLSKLFGTKTNEDTYFGIGTFYSILRDNSAGTLDAAIMRDIYSVTKDTFRHLANSLNRFERVESAFLFELMPEISFYIGGTHLVNKLKGAGLPICFPKPLPMDDRRFDMKDIYDVSFAIRVMADTGINKLDNVIVTNDFVMGDKEGRIGVLTGANQGGKTTITRALGLCQLMFQAGLPVAGTSGEISPCDNIFTHFPELEKNSVSEGRLGEECVRLEQILPKLSKYSMILMNESLSSTSHQECLFIATEIMRYLRTIGARALFATHIHELAENIPELNKEPGLSDMMSLVAGIDESSSLEVMTEDGIKKLQTGSKRTYKITRMPPQGRSFALDIARTYGISYDQLISSHDKEQSETQAETQI